MSPKQTRTQSDTADAVFLAGSFNDWNPIETPMVRDEDGHWTDCTHCIMNDFGTMNRVLAVP